VSEQSSGLRFDIYERVHLSEDIEGIQDLEEIELTPHIQVLSQNEQAVLKGHLLLRGSYVGESESRGPQTLEHRIPVEITLPLNRIQNLEEIGVEIENFDVDLLSARSLNVTGVLSLNGVELQTEAAGQWRNDEEIVVSHKAGGGDREEKAKIHKEEVYGEIEAAADQANINESPAANVEANVAAANVNEAAVNEPVVNEAAAVEAAENAEAANQAIENENAAVEAAEKPKENKKKPILSFLSKKSEEKEKVDLKAAVHTPKEETAKKAVSNAKKDAPKREEAEVEQTAASAEDSASESAKEAVQWKKLFLSSESEEAGFKKVRMCIVQKEETLETIAQRYSLKPNEIKLYNRLGDEDITEGQIIYIPVSS
jgi:stage VI sporulation protein D